MRIVHGIAVAISIATNTFVMPARAASTDPLQVVYFFPGAIDFGIAFQGVATAVACSNFSGATEKVQVAALDALGIVKANLGINIPSLTTKTIVTHPADLYVENLSLGSGALSQGVLVVFSTTTNVVCAANVVAAGAGVVSGFNLHGVRFNPWGAGEE